MTKTAARPRRRVLPPAVPRKQTSGPHFEAFAKTYCRHTRARWTGLPLEFEKWQRALWNEALRLDPKTSRRIYQSVVSGRPRKNYKTTECAALGLYLVGADGEPGPFVAIGSGTKEQAGHVFNQAREFVEANPDLKKLFVPQVNVITAPRLNGVLRRVSSEGRFQHGLNLSGGVIDELHVFETERDDELVTAIITATGSREEPLIAGITTAGYDKDTLLGRMYDGALKWPHVDTYGWNDSLIVARNPEAGELMWWYGAPEDADIENPRVWRAANPAESITIEYLARQFAKIAAGTLTENDFRRLHLNQWVSALDRWILDAVLRRCFGDAHVPARAPVYVGVDVGLTHDTTGVTWAWNRPDGKTVHRTHVFSARPEVAHDEFHPGGVVDLERVSQFISQTLCEQFAVREVVYDPRFFEGEAQRLGKMGVRIAPFEQNSALMADAYTRYYQDVHQERIVIGAPSTKEGRVLVAHIEAAAGVKTERGWLVKKLKSAKPIDACVAAVMAHARATQKTGSVYERRGLLVIGGADERRERARSPYEDEDD